MDDAFIPVDATMTAFIEAVIMYAPVILAPLRMQLANARTMNARNGWLHVEHGADGQPVDWPVGCPLEIALQNAHPEMRGPRGFTSLMCWFRGDGRLDTIEFLNDEDGAMDIVGLTAYLEAIRPSAEDIADFESRCSIDARSLRGGIT